MKICWQLCKQITNSIRRQIELQNLVLLKSGKIGNWLGSSAQFLFVSFTLKYELILVFQSGGCLQHFEHKWFQCHCPDEDKTLSYLPLSNPLSWKPLAKKFRPHME